MKLTLLGIAPDRAGASALAAGGGLRRGCALSIAAALACAHGRAVTLAQAQADLAPAPAKAMDEFAQVAAHPSSEDERLAALRGRIEAARAAGALERVTSELRASSKRGAAEFYELGLAEFAIGNERDAVIALRRAAELGPNEAELHYRLGLALLDGEHFADALEPLQRAANLLPKVARFRPPLALCLGKLGKTREALEALRDLPQLSPLPDEAARAVQTARALTDLFRGVQPEARADLEASLAALVRDTPALAVPKLEELIARLPDLAAAHALLGLACARLDEAGRAVAELREASRLAPDLPQPHAWLAELFMTRQRADLAAPEFLEALARNPLDVEALKALGELRLGKSDKDALAPLRDAATLAPADDSLQLLLARAEIVAGQPQAAQSRLEELLQRRPDDAEVCLRLALLLYDVRARAPETQRKELGDRVESLVRRVLAVQPENAMANQLLSALRG